MDSPDAAGAPPSGDTGPVREYAPSLDPSGASKNKLMIGGALLLAALLYASYRGDGPRYPPGVLAPEEPYQTASDHAVPWEFKGCRIQPLAHIRMRARVLSAERYWFDGGARVSPMDLALGWGPMSDQRILDQLKVWQGRRWYHWSPRSRTIPLSGGEISRYSANMHMIPSSDQIKDRLFDIEAGRIVEISGDLVEVQGPGGWKWRSSLQRDDIGNGACELIWVREVLAR